MQIEHSVITDVGKKRERNEDHCTAHDALKLFVVADGMGGHLGGETASRIAVETIEEGIRSLEEDPEATLQTGAELRRGDYKSWLRYSIGLASVRIFERAAADTRLHGMGTTTVAMLFRGNKVYIANVGDSRGYRLREGHLEQLTQDHSLISEQVRAGVIIPQEAKEHRLKNIITRSVGFQEEVDVDTDMRVVKKGDIYMLCSDGLSNNVSDREVLDTVLHNDLPNACRRLVDLANERGGDDNISVILIKVISLEQEEELSTLKG